MRLDQERLQDILEAIQKIEQYAQEGKTRFEQDELVQTWILYHLQIIGEAAGRLSGDIRSKYPNIPWPQIISLRNIIVHNYFGIDLEEIWATVERDVPVLLEQIKTIENDINSSEEE